MSERIIQVDAPHFCAALITQNGRCIAAAPILKWTIGKTEEELRPYFLGKGWRALECRR